MPDAQSRVRGQYDASDLTDRIVTALRAVGLDPTRLTITELAPVDQFHSGGIAASRELGQLASLAAGMRVLDLGGGIGGPARLLAAEFGCSVDVIDLTPSFCAAGERLTTATGLAGRVRFTVGNALEPPFPDGTFDACWTQHSTMNIEDKPALYRAAHRMLRAGGVLAMHEITAGGGGAPRYPVPWAAEDAISHLLLPTELRHAIEDAGFRPREWQDVSDAAVVWFRERLRPAPETPPPLGPHVLLGRQSGPSFHNLLENLEHDRVRAVMAVFERID